MHFVWFRNTSLSVCKFVQIQERGPNFLGEPVLQNVWIIWSPLLYSNLKSSVDPNSASFIGFQSILHESGRLFSESLNFFKLKRGYLISGGNQFCRMSKLFVPPFCFSILKLFYTQILRRSLHFNLFILHDSGVLFSESWNLYKLKRGDLISGRNQFCRMSKLFVPPFCFSILKLFYTQILRRSLHFNLFILHDSGVLFSESWNLYKLKRGYLISGRNEFCRMSELFGPPSLFQF